MSSVLASADLLAAVIQSSNDAIYTVDLDRSVTSWNAGAVDLFGYKAAEMLGESIDVLTASHRGEESKAFYLDVFKSRHREHFETEMQAKSGRSIPVSVRISPLRDAAGHIVGASAIVRDLFARKTTDQLLRAHSEELERSNAELEQFAHTISHDLQEPLRTMKGFADLIERSSAGKLDKQTTLFLDRIVKGANRMQELVNDLLEYARAGAEGVRFAPVDCEAVLGAALADLEAAINESGAIVTHDPLPTVQGDHVRLTELLENLMTNAMKFRGSKAPLIHIGAQRDHDKWRFCMRDNGIGMEQRYAERIFQPFRRLHTREAYSGSGMGLAICRKIIERHGGDIWVESKPGAGSTFFFTLPPAQEPGALKVRLP